MKTKITKPSELINSVLQLDTCPETGEKQKIVDFKQSGVEDNMVELTTKGKSTSWKHLITIKTTEI